MVAIGENDIQKEQAFFNDFWKMIKKYYEPDGANDFWYDVMAEARELDKKYQTRLGEHLMNAFMDYLEEKQTMQKKLHTRLNGTYNEPDLSGGDT